MAVMSQMRLFSKPSREEARAAAEKNKGKVSVV
jgi:hypothetical protein